MSSTDGPRPARPSTAPVSLTRIADLLGIAVTGDAARTEGDATLAVTGITHDSADVRPGDLFAALPGARHHGREFVDVAVASGAVAVLTDARGRGAAAAAGVPALVVLDPRAVLGTVAAEIYDRPARALLTLGVTGTNGKTTTAHLIHHALGELGRRAGLVGTIETRVGDEAFASVRTTPESTDLQALLAVMRERGADSVVMEVSSIAVSMGRVDGFVLDVIGFTNLSQDHLDFHGDMESYFAAKAAAFTPEHARSGVVVVDDAYGRRLAAEATVPVTTVSTLNTDADWCATAVRAAAGGRTAITVLGPGGIAIDTELGLTGRFNVVNAVLAIAMLAEAGIDVRTAVEGIASCTGVPGRMESVDAGQPFLAVVDYAHTPGAVEAVLADLRESAPGRVLLVLGCGGDRDAAKRPMMGEAGARGADVLVVTDDNPRSEDPTAIRAAMLTGARAVPDDERAEVLEIGDRAEAIAAAVDLAAPGDVVLVAGKGHEQGQESGGTTTPFDDRDALRAALTKRMAS